MAAQANRSKLEGTIGRTVASLISRYVESIWTLHVHQLQTCLVCYKHSTGRGTRGEGSSFLLSCAEGSPTSAMQHLMRALTALDQAGLQQASRLALAEQTIQEKLISAERRHHEHIR
jgi:hypothetical protein